MEALCDLHDQVGESPLWSAPEQALWWVDIEGRRLHRFDWATRRTDTWATPERTGCIALHAEGGLLAAMETGLFHVRAATGQPLDVRSLATVRHAQPGMRFNDGRCDRAGRFWAGTMVMRMQPPVAAGALYRFDAQGLSAPRVEGLVTPNGLAFSPDNRTLYLSDSHPSVQRIWAFDLHDDASLHNRREFVDMNAYPGRPDGAAVDADGGYWICANDAGLVHRFLPDGRLERSIAVPAAKPSMCAFGGPDLGTLFVTTIRLAPEAADAKADPGGALFATRPGVAGLAEAPWRP